MATRSKVPWTQAETNHLLVGVGKFGPGQWKLVLQSYPFHSSRSSVSLKDKWRSLQRQTPRMYRTGMHLLSLPFRWRAVRICPKAKSHHRQRVVKELIAGGPHHRERLLNRPARRKLAVEYTPSLLSGMRIYSPSRRATAKPWRLSRIRTMFWPH
jgi:hypothetical protein